MKIKNQALNKVKRYAKKVGNDEIGGLLLGKVKNGIIEIQDAIILKQIKTIATFQLDDDALMQFTKNASAKKLKSVIGWWHSHGNGGTFWSDVDNETCKRLCKMYSGLCVSMVVSNVNRGLQKYRVDINHSTLGVISLDNVIPEQEVDDRWFKRNKLTKAESKEIDKLVKDDDRPRVINQWEWPDDNYYPKPQNDYSDSDVYGERNIIVEDTDENYLRNKRIGYIG